MYLIVYDITEPKRLSRVAKMLNRYGVRVQKSVFECDIDENKYQELRSKLVLLIDENDSIMSYKLRGYGEYSIVDDIQIAENKKKANDGFRE